MLLVMVLSSPANSWHHDLCIGVPKRSGVRLCGEGMAASGKGGCSNNRGQQKLLEGFPGRWQLDQITSKIPWVWDI